MTKALLQLHLAILLWGATGILGKLIPLPYLLLVWYRLAITLLSLGLFHYISGNMSKLTMKQAMPLLGTGALQCLHWICFFASIQYANVSVALICLSSVSLFTALLEPILTPKKIRIQSLIIGCLPILAISLMYYSNAEYGQGIYYGIASAVILSVIPISNKQHLVHFNAHTISLYTVLGGTVISTILLLLVPFNTLTTLPNTQGWLLLLVLSWLCTILTWYLSLASLRKISAFTQNVLLNLEPLYGIGLAVLFLQENKVYNLYFYIGIAILIGTVILQSTLEYNHARKIS